MKKFITLFMATVVATSMFALPQKPTTEKRGRMNNPAEKNLALKANLEKDAKASDFAFDRKAVEKKTEKQQAAKVVAPKANLAKVVQEDEVMELNYDGIANGPIYTEETGDWTVGLECNDWENPAYGHMLQLAWYAPADNYCGTFTTEDFNPEYTHMMTGMSMGSILFESVEMTISAEKKSAHLEVITLDAVLKGGSDGWSNYPTYKVHAVQEIVVAKDTVDVAPILNATLERGEYGFTIAAKNADMDLTLVVNNPYSVDGLYTYMTAFDWEQSKVVYKGNEISPLNINLKIAVGESQGKLAYLCDLGMLGNDTVYYNMDIASPLPAPVDTIEITCTNLKVDDSYAMYFGMISLEASNNEYSLYGSWAGDYTEEGLHTGAQLSINNDITGEYITAITATYDLSMAEDGNWKIEGTALGDNLVWYELHLSWYIPEMSDTVVIRYETSAVAQYYPAYADLLLFNEDDKYYAALDVMGVYYAEDGMSFTIDDMDMMWTSVEVIDDGNWVREEIITVQNGMLVQVGDTTKMSAEISTMSGVLYQVELWYAAPTPKETVTLNYPTAEFINAINDAYCYNLVGYGADSLTMMVVTIPAYSTDMIAGEFVNDGLFGQFGMGRYEIDANTTFYAVWNEDLWDYDRYFVQKGEVNVELAEDGSITLTGKLICDNAVEYDIAMTTKYERPHLDYDATDTPVERTYGAADMSQLLDWTADYGLIFMELKSATEMDMVQMYFVAEEGDADIVIPEGTYEINNSWEYGSVVASTGVDYEGKIQPSYYGMTDAEGYLITPLYYFVEGTVEVTKTEAGKLRIEIHAINSYEVPIHIVYDPSSTAVEDIQASTVGAKKAIKNGQLIIIRNGEKYNAVGAKL
ncbi:MAG: hypothetical protein IKT71_08165 [Paludibacteraceae bacterium]|nr:hypothetical protein [Paludibacteraceae bacterium]